MESEQVHDGQRVRDLRKARGWLLPDLSRQTGVAVTSLSCIERGTERPWPAAMRAIAQAFGMATEDVFPNEVERRLADLLESLGLKGAQGNHGCTVGN